ncbi:Fc.00g050820.m01.CDS01 [Cosmosporella sp. VM-42]
MSAGTEFPTLAAHTAPPPPIPTVSRYRGLRGKSISTPRWARVFEVYKDNDTTANIHSISPSGSGVWSRNGSSIGLRTHAQEPSSSSISMRRRSRSVAAAPTRSGLTPSPTGGLAPNAAVGAIGSPSPPWNLFRKTSARYALAPPLVRIAPDAGDGPEIDSQAPSSLQLFPTALSPKPINIPSSKDLQVHARAAKSLSPAHSVTDLARLKDLNGLAFKQNGRTSDRATQLERDEVERRRKEEREAARWADEVARLEAETDRILAEQKKRDAARERAQLVTPPSKPRYLILEKFTFLSLGRRSNANSSQPATPSPTPTNTVFSLDFSRSSSLESPDKMSFIEQGGKGIVPGTDAPTSASNGGERRVTVRCLSSTINLPITPETSPVDILFSTANLTPHDIDPNTHIIVECYVNLGLERRLRRYERIRDVMNSWDLDKQNTLLVLTQDISEKDRDLDLASVPRTQQAPLGFSLQIYHSNRPGKWVKKWITLLENGQMFASKKPDGKLHDKDTTMLCHLSDFDIYKPRDSEAKRHLKAPKKYNYAVKSQQKTNVFSNNTENFVHFFSSDDRQLADRFHELVHGWRSWYLVNKKVDLTKKEDKAPQIAKRAGTVKYGMTKSKSVVKNGSHRLQVSVDETPYTIGAFQPLLDLNQFDKPLEEFGKDFIPEEKPEPAPEPEKRPKEIAGPKILTKSHGQPPSAANTSGGAEGEFSPKGLLGSTYEEKRRQTERPSHEIPLQTGPFTDGPSLLNCIFKSPTSPQENAEESRPWFPSATEHTAQKRTQVRPSRRPITADSSGGGRQKPQPLLNLTNNFPEPPRHQWREGQGHGHKAPSSGGPLINFATGRTSSYAMRGSTRTGSALTGGAPPLSHGGVPGGRPRSRSTVGLQPSNRHFSEAPPVPALPNRSIRREKTQSIESTRGRDPRPREPLIREPLIKRAGTAGTVRH